MDSEKKILALQLHCNFSVLFSNTSNIPSQVFYLSPCAQQLLLRHLLYFLTFKLFRLSTLTSISNPEHNHHHPCQQLTVWRDFSSRTCRDSSNPWNGDGFLHLQSTTRITAATPSVYSAIKSCLAGLNPCGNTFCTSVSSYP